MKNFAIILSIVLVIGLYVFLRFLIKRICFIITIENFTKKYKYQLKKKLGLCLLPLNNSSNSSIIIETDSSIYDIKLFGLFLKHCEIHFWSMKEYSTRWYFSRYDFYGAPPIGKTNAKPRRSLGDFDCTIYTDSATQKERIPVLLISPANAPVRLTQLLVNQVVAIRAGEKIGDVLLADSDFLYRYINRRENK